MTTPYFERIDEIVRGAFGKTVHGDFQQTCPGSECCLVRSEGNLGLIRGWFTTMGRFENQDGSRLVVKPEYVSAGRSYQRLFEKAFGRPVEIYSSSAL